MSDGSDPIDAHRAFVDSPRRAAPRPADRTGFTLIELLVVIAIISLIVSILLPSLAGARRAAQTAVCAAGLRAMIQGVSQYGLDQEEWIVGSPSGSGAHITGSAARGAPTQIWDFMNPLLKQWGIPLQEGPTVEDIRQRFNMARHENKSLVCPTNDVTADQFGGPAVGSGRMISYNTSRYIMFQHVEGGASDGKRVYSNIHEERLPKRWSPRLTRVGDAARKAFCADGARYIDTTLGSVRVDFDLNAQATWGGAFSDAGPYSSWSRGWQRGVQFGVDLRVFAFRHSAGPPQTGAAPNSLRTNVAFFDGHVDLLGDLDAANPTYWLPAGSQLEVSGSWPEVRKHFGLPASGLINVN